MDKFALQAKLDKQKWDDSVAQGRDMCGAYDFCAFCDKSVAMPCASAFEKMNEPKPAPAPVKEETEDVTEIQSSLGKKFDYDKVMAKKAARKSLTFAEKSFLFCRKFFSLTNILRKLDFIFIFFIKRSRNGLFDFFDITFLFFDFTT